MKKILLVLVAILMGSLLISCGPNASEVAKDDVTIRIAGLKGPTSIGMVKMMEDQANGKQNCEFTIAASADEITPKLVKGELDMAAVPANLASVLYNNTDGKIDVIAINTLGVIYVVENADEIKTVADLKGKTVYASGKGSTPEYAFRYILKENGIDPDNDVNIEWKSEHAEVVSAIQSAGTGIGLLPQPFVTAAQSQIDNLHIALDLTKEWESITDESTMITGVLVARKDFVDEHENAVSDFLKAYKESTDYVNANVKDAAALVEKHDIFKAAIAEKAIPYCNIVCITGEEMKDDLTGYLNVLYEANPKSVGGKLPEDDFYTIIE